jgi:glycosyltransferase involved in cell wall biosynthesis
MDYPDARLRPVTEESNQQSQPARLRIASFSKRLQVAGDENRLLSFSRSVDRTRFDHFVIVAVATDDERNARIGPMVKRYQEAGIELEILNLELSGLRDSINYVRLFLRLRRIFRERRVDVLDARLSLPTVIGGLAARVSGVSAIVSTQYYPSAWRPPILWIVGQVAFATLIDAFVTDADATIKLFERWRLSRRAPLVMIPNGVLPAVATKGRAEVREALGLPGGPNITVIGQVSRMIPRKGYDTFIAAAQQVAKAAPETVFVCCGFAEDPDFRRTLQDSANNAGISDRMVFVDYHGPIGDVMGAIDLFAHLSTEDSSPIAFHESMSAGLPAVVTSLPGNQELFEDEVTALAVPPNDVEATVSAMLRLLRDPVLAARLGNGARQRYLARHTPERMARSHEQLFTTLVTKRRARASRRA